MPELKHTSLEQAVIHHSRTDKSPIVAIVTGTLVAALGYLAAFAQGMMTAPSG